MTVCCKEILNWFDGCFLIIQRVLFLTNRFESFSTSSCKRTSTWVLSFHFLTYLLAHFTHQHTHILQNMGGSGVGSDDIQKQFESLNLNLSATDVTSSGKPKSDYLNPRTKPLHPLHVSVGAFRPTDRRRRQIGVNLIDRKRHQRAVQRYVHLKTGNQKMHIRCLCNKLFNWTIEEFIQNAITNHGCTRDEMDKYIPWIMRLQREVETDVSMDKSLCLVRLQKAIPQRFEIKGNSAHYSFSNDLNCHAKEERERLVEKRMQAEQRQVSPSHSTQRHYQMDEG